MQSPAVLRVMLRRLSGLTLHPCNGRLYPQADSEMMEMMEAEVLPALVDASAGSSASFGGLVREAAC